ncbi:hypothetical protein [Pyxidicoccus trucidator]|uniref:hypothetical protein n=1 Tax=Pyxidicoccus trucidator TaxID=2709662 RepID=UPI001967348D|nr:hypothetical protein [Pyxidicoccus trucidator]
MLAVPRCLALAVSAPQPETGAQAAPPGRYAVKLKVEEAEGTQVLPAGARGHAAIYTQSLHPVCYRVGQFDLRMLLQPNLLADSVRVLLLRMRSEQLSQRINLHLALAEAPR